jgi:hypothetical protein
MGGIFSRFKSPPPPPPGAVVISDDATKVDLSSRGIRQLPKDICALKQLQVRTRTTVFFFFFFSFFFFFHDNINAFSMAIVAFFGL